MNVTGRNIIVFVLIWVILLTSCSNSINTESLQVDKLLSIKMREALLNNNVELVREALSLGANVDKFESDDIYVLSFTNKKEYNPLAIAVSKQEYMIAELLLSQGANPNILTADGFTLLQISSLEFAKTLLDHGANVELKNSKNQDVFDIKASNCEETEALAWTKLYLEYGGQITPERAKSCFDNNLNKPYSIIKYLEDVIPDFNANLSKIDLLFYKAAFEELDKIESDTKIRNDRGETLINIAAKYGNLTNVKTLYELGADIYTEGFNGRYNALDYAIENGYIECVKYFKEKGESVIEREDDVFSTTARNLRKCVSNGHFDCLSYVLSVFEECYEKDSLTAGACMAVERKDDKSLELLLLNGADISECAKTCLYSGNLKIAQVLIENGADFTYDGNELYYVACHYSDMEAAQFIKILEKVNPQSIERDTCALQTAVETGKMETVRALINVGIDINKRYFDSNKTILMFAARSTNEIFKFLIDSGADLYAKDDYGKSIKDYLTYDGCIDTNKMLMLSNVQS